MNGDGVLTSRVADKLLNPQNKQQFFPTTLRNLIVFFFHEEAKTVITLSNGQVLEDPHEKVRTGASRSPIIVYERKNNREENANPNKENEK